MSGADARNKCSNELAKSYDAQVATKTVMVKQLVSVFVLAYRIIVLKVCNISIDHVMYNDFIVATEIDVRTIRQLRKGGNNAIACGSGALLKESQKPEKFDCCPEFQYSMEKLKVNL